MYVYTGTRMRGIPYRRVMVPSIGHRGFSSPSMGTETTITENVANASLATNLVRGALLVATGVAAWKIYTLIRSPAIEANLPSWPAIGPLFNVGSSIGSAFSLGPYIL